MRWRRAAGAAHSNHFDLAARCSARPCSTSWTSCNASPDVLQAKREQYSLLPEFYTAKKIMLSNPRQNGHFIYRENVLMCKKLVCIVAHCIACRFQLNFREGAPANHCIGNPLRWRVFAWPSTPSSPSYTELISQQQRVTFPVHLTECYAEHS